jgi:hypothetical protein
MVNFIEYASKAQEELNKERAEIAEKAQKQAEQASVLAARTAALDEREAQITKSEYELQEKQEKLSAWEAGKRREEEVVAIFDSAQSKLVEAQEKLKAASEKESDTRLALEDLSKRELALSEREKVYKEEIKTEIMNRFLGH